MKNNEYSYPHGGSFIPHVDGAKAWALAISIGESAIFFTCETEKGERTRMRIDSGDAIIFKGGMLYHGVEEILPGTAPKFWYRNEEIRYSPCLHSTFYLN